MIDAQEMQDGGLEIEDGGSTGLPEGFSPVDSTNRLGWFVIPTS